MNTQDAKIEGSSVKGLWEFSIILGKLFYYKKKRKKILAIWGCKEHKQERIHLI